MNVGFLHPGLMGETLAANCNQPAFWVAAGRSDETRVRAEANDMVGVESLPMLAEQCGIIVSICPPGAALSVAEAVAATSFDGVYVDANAISPDTARTIHALFSNYVDGSVIGPPAHVEGTTRLYLSGPAANQVAELYECSVLDARVIGDGPAAASALKMAYASWTKIGSAMHLAIRSLAASEGVDAALIEEWNLSQPGMVERSDRIAAGVSPKAWRFTGEMEQIADAFAAQGLPDGFATAALEVYTRMTGFKGTQNTTLDEVIAAIDQT